MAGFAGLGVRVLAVGHQTDNSLCDLAADVRAPTPSAAAELAIAPKEEFEALLERHGQRLRRTLRQQTQLAASRLVAAGASEFLRRPERILERFAQQLDNLGMRMASSMRQRAQSERRRLDHTSASLLLLRLRQMNAIEVRLEDSLKRLTGAWRIQLERRRGRVENAQRHLALLSPLAVLERGYSLTRTADGRLVRTVDEVEPGAVLTTQIKDGLIKSRVE